LIIYISKFVVMNPQISIFVIKVLSWGWYYDFKRDNENERE